MTKHFIDRWQSRVGGRPTEELVMSILRQSMCIQPQSVFRCADGSTFSTLCINWHPGLKLVIKTDPSNNTAVTVYSQDMNPS